MNIAKVLDLYNTIPSFLLILFRVSSFLGTFPMFSMTTIPPRLLIVFSFLMSLIIWQLYPIPQNIDLFSFYGLQIILNQILIGVTSGFIFTLTFYIFIGLGELAAMQTGLGFASLIDPHINQLNIIGQFYWLLIAVFFLLLNGHLFFIEMLFNSFKILPVTAPVLSVFKLKTLIAFGSVLFSGTILVALPIVISLLALNIVFAVMTRAVPQLNIFSIVFPLMLIFGLITIYFSLQIILDNSKDYFNQAFEMLHTVLLANTNTRI